MDLSRTSLFGLDYDQDNLGPNDSCVSIDSNSEFAAGSLASYPRASVESAGKIPEEGPLEKIGGELFDGSVQ